MKRIKKIYFDNVNLDKVEFFKLDLKDVDLSNSNISGLTTDLHSIKGIIIDRFQSQDLVRLLGVNFKE